jgi:hypothetical protein
LIPIEILNKYKFSVSKYSIVAGINKKIDRIAINMDNSLNVGLRTHYSLLKILRTSLILELIQKINTCIVLTYLKITCGNFNMAIVIY